MFLDGSSGLERGGVWYVWGCFWPWSRCQGAPRLSLGARLGPLELAGHQCVCLSHGTYMFLCCPISGIQ